MSDNHLTSFALECSCQMDVTEVLTVSVPVSACYMEQTLELLVHNQVSIACDCNSVIRYLPNMRL